MSDKKYCIDCKFYEYRDHGGKCNHPSNLQRTDVCLVTGSSLLIRLNRPADMRNTGAGCGSEGGWWQPLPNKKKGFFEKVVEFIDNRILTLLPGGKK